MISIVLTTFNGEKYISKQLESIVKQSITDYELVICDDCSTDNTINIIKKFSENDNRIILYRNNINLGYAKNFLNALNYTSGDIIFFSDQDDYWFPNKLKIMYDICKRNKDVQMLISKGINFKGEIPKLFANKNKFEKEKKLSFENIISRCSYQGCDLCITKEMKNKVLKLNNEKILAHDWFFSLIGASEDSCYYIDINLMFHRIRNDSTSRIKSSTRKGFNEFVLKKQLNHIIWGKEYKSIFNEKDYSKYCIIEKWFYLRLKLISQNDFIDFFKLNMILLFITLKNNLPYFYLLKDNILIIEGKFHG